MRPRTAIHACRARASLVWFAIAFASMSILASCLVEYALPEARDPEFTLKLTILRGRLTQTPNMPLVLMLGSSRTALGFRAGDVQLKMNGDRILAYNFALRGGGPFVELLTLRRLLKEGIRPKLLLVEVFPPLLNNAKRHSLEEVWFQSGRMSFGEIASLESYHTEPWRLIRRWFIARLEPWLSLHWIADWPASARRTGAKDFYLLGDHLKVDRYGWEPYPSSSVNPAGAARARSMYRDSMREFAPAERSIAAVRALLALCEHERIPTALVLMTEGSAFRSFYPPMLSERLEQMVRDISHEYAVPLFDARAWVADVDLADAHHPLPTGATNLTKRLTHEVIEPLLSQNQSHR